MKILITGAGGFIGKNLIAELRNRGYKDEDLLFCYSNTPLQTLADYAEKCDFVFHLAGVNRPEKEEEFLQGNRDFTELLIASIQNSNCRIVPFLMTSSIQATLDNPYGRSKRAAEQVLLDRLELNYCNVQHTIESGVHVNRSGLQNDYDEGVVPIGVGTTEVRTQIFPLIYRLPNVFGKWGKPNYNSAVTTFCYNIARDLPVTVRDRAYSMELVYIDDVVNTFISNMEEMVKWRHVNALPMRKTLNSVAADSMPNMEKVFYKINPVYEITLGEIVDLIYDFNAMRSPGGAEFLQVPDFAEDFTKKLYSTYLSYLPEDKFSYELRGHEDERGSFTEFLKTPNIGQISVNVTKPGITKGNHWHHTKVEKFLVVSGEAEICFRNIAHTTDVGGMEQVPLRKSEKDRVQRIIKYRVSGRQLEVVDIPPGYTHSITNVGESDLVTIMWAGEIFDINRPDTYHEEV